MSPILYFRSSIIFFFFYNKLLAMKDKEYGRNEHSLVGQLNVNTDNVCLSTWTRNTAEKLNTEHSFTNSSMKLKPQDSFGRFVKFFHDIQRVDHTIRNSESTIKPTGNCFK